MTLNGTSLGFYSLCERSSSVARATINAENYCSLWKHFLNSQKLLKTCYPIRKSRWKHFCSFNTFQLYA